MKIFILVIIVWLMLGLGGAGFDNAYFQRKWPDQCDGRKDLGRAFVMVPFGPLNLVMSYLLTGFGEYGWSLQFVANSKCVR